MRSLTSPLETTETPKSSHGEMLLGNDGWKITLSTALPAVIEDNKSSSILFFLEYRKKPRSSIAIEAAMKIILERMVTTTYCNEKMSRHVFNIPARSSTSTLVRCT